jgi:(1->4)-alpha-D-glucan 1-alpha-D-glucosylmutase
VDRDLEHQALSMAVPEDPRAASIEADYRDAWGAPRQSPPETIARLTATLAPLPGAAHAEPPVPASTCFVPPWMERGERAWGIGVQLYSLRSARNWGIGDFTDLNHVISLAAAEGADFVAVNPLHALFAGDPGRYSPYAPASRHFLNVLYIDVAAMRIYPAAAAAQISLATPLFQRLLTELRQRDTIDYAGVAAAKDSLCRMCFAAFAERCGDNPDDPLVRAFDAFLQEQGEPLRQFALYQALSLQPGFGSDWTRWPAPYHDPQGGAATAFAAAHDDEIRYHAFLQWEADLQLASCAEAARRSGMRIGLYLDLALGTAPESADGWVAQASIIPGFHIGAPPDQWNESGQDWGLFAYQPQAVADTDGTPIFRRVLHANMRHAGALRLDHVLGFNRLFLIPADGRPADGVYLRYPAAKFCATIAAESTSHRAIVVGEDLGTIPDGLQDMLAAYGLLSYRLLIFSRDDQGRFLPPQAYPRAALVAVSTHDLPTLAGFWTGHDIEIRAALNLYPDDAARQRAVDERQATKVAILAALHEAGLNPADGLSAIAKATHVFLARTSSALMFVQIEDLALERDQTNLPGTVDIYPNWRRKLSRSIDDIFGDAETRSLLAAIRAERPRDPIPPP